MANQRVFSISGGNGVEFYIEFNEANDKIGEVFFTIPPTLSGAHLKLWDNGQLVYDAVYPPGSYSEHVPGNYKVTYYTDEEGTYPFPPPEISWSFEEIR